MNKHPETSECGFDRNASISENRYVCLCGQDHKSAAPAADPRVTLSAEQVEKVRKLLKMHSITQVVCDQALAAQALAAQLRDATQRAEEARKNALHECAKICFDHMKWLTENGDAEKARTAATLLDAIRALHSV